MLETAFPGIDVVLTNHPPTFPKRLLSKVVPVVQIGAVGLVVAGEHIFPMLGFMTPPPWYYSLRANKFGTIASTWLLGNALQSFLQSTGAFEVYLNNELVSDLFILSATLNAFLIINKVFSKLKEGRFPGEIELRDIIGKKLGNSGVGSLLG
ncbi:Selenoprotein T [Parasponia andersonii]|uniref:Selenoprotein T n=1 Tax=Parasponia andersonii TaxID=3476 RepID=A0A2P5AR72_PARAD|nr:Selenoprotein T [Parasponia andersonii]